MFDSVPLTTTTNSFQPPISNKSSNTLPSLHSPTKVDNSNNLADVIPKSKKIITASDIFSKVPPSPSGSNFSAAAELFSVPPSPMNNSFRGSNPQTPSSNNISRLSAIEHFSNPTSPTLKNVNYQGVDMFNSCPVSPPNDTKTTTSADFFDSYSPLVSVKSPKSAEEVFGLNEGFDLSDKHVNINSTLTNISEVAFPASPINYTNRQSLAEIDAQNSIKSPIAVELFGSNYQPEVLSDVQFSNNQEDLSAPISSQMDFNISEQYQMLNEEQNIKTVGHLNSNDYSNTDNTPKTLSADSDENCPSSISSVNEDITNFTTTVSSMSIENSEVKKNALPSLPLPVSRTSSSNSVLFQGKATIVSGASPFDSFGSVPSLFPPTASSATDFKPDVKANNAIDVFSSAPTGTPFKTNKTNESFPSSPAATTNLFSAPPPGSRENKTKVKLATANEIFSRAAPLPEVVQSFNRLDPSLPPSAPGVKAVVPNIISEKITPPSSNNSNSFPAANKTKPSNATNKATKLIPNYLNPNQTVMSTPHGFVTISQPSMQTANNVNNIPNVPRSSDPIIDSKNLMESMISASVPQQTAPVPIALPIALPIVEPIPIVPKQTVIRDLEWRTNHISG